MNIGRIIGFALLSLIYWFAALSITGAFTYASICHYPDVPACRTDLTLPVVVGVAAIAGYVAIGWWFVRHIRRSRGSDK